ncbi:MAG: hypothetical protein D6690_13975 [Nitrospirae bacterium]|nr:MAG: hypothetical protein D6690_13975 [Nitrospirota bacterium]
MVSAGGRALAHVAKDVGINARMLGRWGARATENGLQACCRHGRARDGSIIIDNGGVPIPRDWHLACMPSRSQIHSPNLLTKLREGQNDGGS